MARKLDDDIEPGNSWGEKRIFHSRDMALRSAGFAIAARPQPGKGPNRWTRHGKVLTEAQALIAAGLVKPDLDPSPEIPE